MTDAMAVLDQGLSWLKAPEAESPEAVVEEATSQLERGQSRANTAAWKTILAEGYLGSCQPEKALDQAGEALAIFKDIDEKSCEALAARTFTKAHLMAGNWEDAISIATAAVDLYQELGDKSSMAAMFVMVAKAYLMKDPHAGARSAISAVEIYRQAGDKKGEAQALQASAEAHLLYDPEQALKAAKEATTACDKAGDKEGKALAQKTTAAAKAQIATMQQATQAASMATRGDGHIFYKWPQYKQQRGYQNPDPFIVEDYTGPEKKNPMNKGKETKAPAFMRRAFKWTAGHHATDGAWYRQELQFVPSKLPQE